MFGVRNIRNPDIRKFSLNDPSLLVNTDKKAHCQIDINFILPSCKTDDIFYIKVSVLTIIKDYSNHGGRVAKSLFLSGIQFSTEKCPIHVFGEFYHNLRH